MQFKHTLLSVKKIGCLVWSGIFVMLSFVTLAQNPQLITTTDKQNIVIGEPLQYGVEATFPAKTYTFSWLKIPDSIAHFEVIERQKPDTFESNGMLKVRQVIMITSFDSGIRTIPSFLVGFEPLNGDTSFNILTDSIRVRVSFSPMDSSKTFHDIKSIILVKDERPLWVWIAAWLCVIALIFLVYYLFKRLRKKKSTGLFASKLSPLDEAIESLSELQKQQLLIKQQVKQFHSGLGEIFKRYISRRVNSNLLTLTSGEVLLRLNELHINKENVGLVASNLRMADAVKFAKYIPGNIDSEEAFLNTKKVIEQIDRSIQNSKSDI